jgi:F-box/leucine-rich repeat protein 2/20
MVSVCMLKFYIFGVQIGDQALISVAENCKSLKELTLQFCER